MLEFVGKRVSRSKDMSSIKEETVLDPIMMKACTTRLVFIAGWTKLKNNLTSDLIGAILSPKGI